MDILNNEKNVGEIETNLILNETKMTDKKARASDKIIITFIHIMNLVF